MRARLSEENLDQIATDRKSKRRSVSTTTPTMIATSMKRKSCTHQLTMQFNAISQVSGFINFFSLFLADERKKKRSSSKKKPKEVPAEPVFEISRPTDTVYVNQHPRTCFGIQN
jgi:hypothetical protein